MKANGKKFIFVGNRKFVLEALIATGEKIAMILAFQNSHLEKEVSKYDIPYSIITSKYQLVETIEKMSFDILISNGCPYILPINNMRPKQYVNIHPSYLPDLKGRDPVIGSILLKRSAGATCHIMNAQIDSGDIISQIKIPYSDDLDVTLLYQLSFIAEQKTFFEAYKKNFKPIKKQISGSEDIYYSRKPNDLIITFTEPLETITAKVRAFSNKSQGCVFILNEEKYRVHQIEILKNPFLKNYSKKFDDFQVIFSYEDCIVFKKLSQIILLRSFTDSLCKIEPGSFLISLSNTNSK